MKKLLFLLGLTSFCFAVTLEYAIKSALEKNATLLSQKKKVEAVKYSIKADRNLYLPEFFLNLSWSWRSDKQTLKVPSFDTSSNIEFNKQNYYSFSLGLKETLFDGGARSGRIEISGSNLMYQKLLLKEKEEDVKLQVIDAYLDVLSAEALIDVYKKELQAVKAHFETAQSFYREGLVAMTDVLQAKVRLSEVERNLRQAEGNRRIALARLSKITGISEKKLSDIGDVSIKIGNIPPLDHLIDKAIKNRPLLKAYYEFVKIAKARQDIYKSQFFPKIFLQADYSYTNFNPVVSPKGFYTLTIGFNLSFQSAEPYYKILQARAEEKEASMNYRDISQRVVLEVKEAYEKLLIARDNLKVAEDTLRFAEEYFRLSKKQYANQLISGADFLDAEAALTRARKNKVISYYEYLKAYFRLMRAVGGKQ